MHNSEIRALPESKREAAYKAKLKDSRYAQDTLADRIEAGLPLSDKEVESGVELLGKRCQPRKRNMLKWALMACPDIENYGILRRVHIEDETLSYCAGQSYPDEIRTVRECLVGR